MTQPTEPKQHRGWTLRVAPDGLPGVRPSRLRRDAAMFGVAGGLIVFSFLGSLSARLLLGTDGTIREAQASTAAILTPAGAVDLRSGFERLGSSLAEFANEDGSGEAASSGDAVRADVRRTGFGPRGRIGPASTHRPGEPRTAMGAADVDHLLRRARLLAFSWREASDSLTSAFDRLASTPSILPTTGTVTSSFSRRRWHPILERSRPHYGLDIVAPSGTPIVAAARGRVVFVGYRSGYGLMIEVDHGYGTVTRYAHASRALARTGQVVERGDMLGRVGRTGLAEGPHLHYEVLVNGQPADPRTFIFAADATPE